MLRQMREHAPELVDIDITMAQAKVLYVVMAAGGLRMSELAARLGVGSSSASELADRLVELGLLERHTDADDRRQVVVTATADAEALLERFRELNMRQLRDLLSRLDAGELAIVERSMGSSTRPSTGRRRPRPRVRPPPHPPPDHPRRDPEAGDTPVSRLSRLALSQAQRHVAARRRPVLRRRLGLGQPQAGTPAGHRLPGHHRRGAVPGRRGDRTSPNRWRSPSSGPSSGVPRLETIQSTSANSIALVIAQFSFGTERQGRRPRPIEENIAKADLPDGVTRPSRRSTSMRRRSSSRRSQRPVRARPRSAPLTSPARDRARDPRRSRASPAPT